MHSAFLIPVDTTEQSLTNLNLSQYDIIIIDEISMISRCTFEHIPNTVSRLIFRPVLVLGGDYAQQQPFKKFTGRIVDVPSPLQNQSFIASTYQYVLKRKQSW